MLTTLRRNQAWAVALGLNWVLWLWAITEQPQWLSGAIAYANFVAVAGYFRMAAHLPASIQRAMHGMGVATGVLGAAELLLAFQRAFSVSAGWLQESLFMAGALTAAFYAFGLPGALERLRLYRPGVARRAVAGSLLAGAACTLVAWLFRPYFTPVTLYTFVTFALFFLFAHQVALMSQNRLRESLLRVVWGLALVSLARVVGIIGGFDPPPWVTVGFTSLWIAGMQVVASSALEPST
ncbi:hypothetical protein [Calidithermus chliarophilus]|uniref:hypothetical protein n=1 Tax=Calidithermus chliarophilus TaxID=52023 RepID=UPI0004283DB6|nr:hypothetical protein [Calidithermus chliarophilus]